MPIFIYECLTCGEAVEFFKLKSDDSIPFLCQKCGSKKLKQIVTSPAIAKLKTPAYGTI